MAGEADIGGKERDLQQTATWAVAGVCAVIILISIVLEKLLHKVGTVRDLTPLTVFSSFGLLAILVSVSGLSVYVV